MRGDARVATFAILLSTGLFSGCSNLKTDYGASRGSQGRKSLNGFAALRASYERADFRTRDVSRLSERVMRSDAIVWTPQVLAPIETEVTRWFERWLRKGDRTLVYVIPDSGSEVDYWTDTAELAPPQQRLEYRKRAAKSINQRMSWRLNRDSVASNGWFTIEPLEHCARLGPIDGPWRSDLVEKAEDDPALETEFFVVAFDADKHKVGGKINPQQVFMKTGPTGPGQAIPWTFALKTSSTKTAVQFSPLLQGATGNPIVAEITSKRWNNSRIIVVAGGSLLTNYALTHSFNGRLAKKIIAESAPARDQDLRAGFMTSDWNSIPVSEVEANVPAVTGMEILTVWPLSLVTMHGVVFGLVICLMLWPIFGRPARIRRSIPGSFKHHLDAVAALMNKTGDERYARARISEYMKRMHGETSGPWILPDPPTPHGTAQLPSKRLSAEDSQQTGDRSDAVVSDKPTVGTDKIENHEAEH